MMLQQTQVATVVDYYHRFIDRFPTVDDLARADLNEVMKVWEGLGYYGRARHLHRAAQEIVNRFCGSIPDTLEGLLSLPGIGRYTAGAVLSIAFDKQAPILDGNVARVLSRVFHVTENVQRTRGRAMLWGLAREFLPVKRVRDFNQALMELGAVVCKSRRPLCTACPFESFCEANKLGVQEALPVRSPKKPIPHHDVTAGVIWKDGKFLITLRPPRGLLGGLWEFPGGKQEDGEGLKDCLRREIREELEVDIEVGDHLVSVKHAYTHFRITLHVFMCRYVEGEIRPLACEDYRWISPDELGDYAFPAADRKAIQAIHEKKIGRMGMKILHYTEMEPKLVDMEGARGVNVRWLIAKEDGAPNFAMRLFEVEAGGTTPLHRHATEHEVFILEGEGAVWREGEEVPVGPGTAVFVPPEEKHCFKNTGEGILRFLCMVPV